VAPDHRAIVKRVVTIVVLGAALMFAVQGGEFSTVDLVHQRTTNARITHSIDSLQKVVDSLKRYRDKLEHDPVTQERIAREMFGMVRGDKELLYRFTDTAETTRRDSGGGVGKR
jgi:septum formation initiator